jgi:pimeloyl-ACP methyl ester carboxylesterase
MSNQGWLAGLYERPINVEGVTAHSIGFGDDLAGDLYMPAKPASAKAPVVVYLHPYAYPTGYSRYAKPAIADLTAKGYAVFAFDQIGFGSRLHQGTRFYERYPNWSLMGKMVADTRAAIDALSALKEIDAARIYLAGYSLGGKVALFSAALDDRVAGIVVASAFTPLRSSKPDDGTEGLRHYAQLHGILPRLGDFAGTPQNVPVDYDEILGAIKAPVNVRAPLYDRYAIPANVRAAVAKATAAGARIELHEPGDFNRFTTAAQREAWAWLEKQK